MVDTQTAKEEGKTYEICYSPSKPLALAWEECEKKGFMMVSRVFTYELMRCVDIGNLIGLILCLFSRLTHGSFEHITHSGRVAERWNGAIHEFQKRFDAGGHNLVNRGGRFDITIPEYVVAALNLNEVLAPITSRLQSIMSQSPPPRIKTHNIIFAPVGSDAQKWHTDDTVRKPAKHNYFTILIHLNTIDNYAGGTEVWCHRTKRGDLIRGRPGDAFVFHGSLWHRGQENAGRMHRFFYYASFACKADGNTEDIDM